ncbi:hypothetical protein T492DRAFT_1019170 [Pavlovales sp. CCMP2436]|nr:hypothetical protein T492DRAFT_1019170 [Pavlovales sp. CCMP2436]
MEARPDRRLSVGRDRGPMVVRASVAGRASLDDAFMWNEAPPAAANRQPTRLLRRVDAVRSRAAADSLHGLAHSLHRLSVNPWLVLVVFIGACMLGSGMIQPLFVEARARHGGIWFPGECNVERMVLLGKSHKVGRSINVDAHVHLGGDVWTYYGAYYVVVRLADGCDGRPEHMPDQASQNRTERAEEAQGFFTRFLFRDTVSVGEAASTAPQDALAEGFTESSAPPDAQAEGFTDAEERRACTAREANLDHLRGEHVAYSDLVVSNGPVCTGPFNATRDESYTFCAESATRWLHTVRVIGAVVPCWAFERKMGNTTAVQVHIVLNRSISRSLSIYVFYLVLLLLLLLRLLYLVGRRALQKRGCLEPDDLVAVESGKKRRRSMKHTVVVPPNIPPPPPTFGRTKPGPLAFLRRSSRSDRHLYLPDQISLM